MLKVGASAPGTFNHSWSVSILGESAAKGIGGNAELARGALFPTSANAQAAVFHRNKSTEEQKPAELLAAMSTLIIIGHVKDGIDLAQQHHLPQPIIDMIEQHHGTTRVDFFYNEVMRDQPRPRAGRRSGRGAFRYPGPAANARDGGLNAHRQVEAHPCPMNQPRHGSRNWSTARAQSAARRPVGRIGPDAAGNEGRIQPDQITRPCHGRVNTRRRLMRSGKWGRSSQRSVVI